jgi:hypothetical protein
MKQILNIYQRLTALKRRGETTHMATPQLTPDQMVSISGLLAEYITTQRAKFSPRALPLSAQERSAMAGYFPPQLLEATRLLVLEEERLSNPDFYPMLRDLGFDDLPDQPTTTNAITFCDVIVSQGAFTNGLLFHELVHAEQYRQLGIARFAELYARGFLQGGGYEAIPLEVNAYTLDAQFGRKPSITFSVADEVARWIAEGRF